MKKKKTLESELNRKQKALASVVTYSVQDILDGLSHEIPFKFDDTNKRILDWIQIYDSECSVLRKAYSEHEVKPSLPILTGKVLADVYSESPDGRKIRLMKHEDGIGIMISSIDLNGNPHTLKFGLRSDAARALRILLRHLDV